MPVAQYGRKLSVVLGVTGGAGIEFSAFRVQFHIRQGDLQTPNTADVRIFNLSDNTASLLRSKTEFTQIVIQAGYEGNFGLIFRGSIKQIRLGKIDQKDSYVDVTAGDADEAYNFAPISASLAAGSPPGGVAAALLDALKSKGVTQGYQPNFSTNGCVRGRALYGLARDELRDFAWHNGCSWSIQNGALTFIPFTSYIPGDVPILSPSTGLIGVPEQTAGGINIRTLLNPNIRLGQCVKLDSTVNLYRYGLDRESQGSNLLTSTSIKLNKDGLYYCMHITHRGDTRGNDWYSDMVCLAVDATVPSVDALNALNSFPAESIKRYD